MNLDTYIEEEWLDYPISKISLSDGVEFAIWLAANDEDEYADMMDDVDVEEYKEALLLKALGKNVEYFENIKTLAEMAWTDYLKSSIQDYKNTFEDESTREEDERDEAESYDRQRLM